MIYVRELEETLAVLPGLMISRRMAMPPAKKGFAPGLRGAAASIGIATATYSRIESGKTPDVSTLIKILKWLEQ